MGNFLSMCTKSKKNTITNPITLENPIHTLSQDLTQKNMEKHNKNSPLNKTCSEERLSEATTIRRVFSFGNQVKNQH
jgi:hypothetical protein